MTVALDTVRVVIGLGLVIYMSRKSSRRSPSSRDERREQIAAKQQGQPSPRRQRHPPIAGSPPRSS